MIFEEKAYAKINLFLEIKNKRKDGYHNIDSIFQTISLHDDLIVEVNHSKGIDIKMNKMDIPLKKNIVYKVTKFFEKYYDKNNGYDIKINKNIPAGGGLGGSSADAAAMLKILEKIYEIDISDKFLNEISRLGADIPFLYTKGMAKVSGIGDKINKLPYKLDKILVVGYQEIEVDTKWAYKNLNLLLTNNKFDSSIFLRCIKHGDFEKIFQNFYNRFEKVVFDRYPKIKKLKNDFLGNNAVSALMSGSGSSVFAIYNNIDEAKDAIKNMSRDWQWLRIAEFEY